MNNLAFQIYGTKKATPFQSVWDTTKLHAVSVNELANIAATTPLPAGWAGTNLLTGGYTHTAGNTASLLVNNLTPTAGQSYQIICTLSGTGSVVINWGGVSSVAISATTTITLTPINTAIKLSITPSNDFAGTVSLSIRQSSSAANQIQLPITVASGKSIWIDWGDNSYSTANSANFIANRIHTYAAQGEYPVRVFGDDFNFGFGDANSIINDRLKIKSISSWGKLKIGLNSFNRCSNVTMSGITDIPDLTGVTSLSGVFSYCSLLTTVGRINEWNTSLVTDMSAMFFYCPLFNSNIGNWNTSAVTNMSNMFGSFNSSSNFNQDISGWNVSNVTNMLQMFDYATSFNQNLSNWERSGSSLSKVTNMSYMFRGAVNFNNGSASGVANQLPWTINTTATSVVMNNMFQGASAFNSNLGTGTTPWDVSKVTAFTYMFNGASSFNNGDEVTQSKINDWNVGGSVTSVSIYSMFRSASTFNRNIGNWNVSKVTDTSNMFSSAIAFNQPLANWERSGSTIGNVTTMQSMFFGATAFNQNIGNWNVTKVTQFAQMFQASGFNNGGSTDINNWSINTSASVNMDRMFVTTGYFNQPLNSWNTSEVTNMSGMFGQSTFNNGLSSGVAGTLAWNTGKVTNMSGMFSINSRFNCNIESWNVSQVTDMSSMFDQSSVFNQPLANWERSTFGNVSTIGNVTTMNRMFFGSAFNQIINNWNVSKVNNFGAMFGSKQYTQPLNLWNIGGDSSVTTINMGSMFIRNGSFNQDISAWNVSKVTNMSLMFYNDATPVSTFNQNISAWNVGNVTNMNGMFSGAKAFNQPIGSWDVSKVTDMSAMFSNLFTNASSMDFNQNIGSWNISNVTNFANFMAGKTFSNFSTANLDAIYNGWGSLPIPPGVKPNIIINFGGARYTALSSAGRALLAAPPNGTGTWTITDGGITA